MPKKRSRRRNAQVSSERSPVCVISQSSRRAHNSSTGPARNACSASDSGFARNANSAGQSGAPENSSPSQPTLPASSATRSVSPSRGRSLATRGMSGRVIQRRRARTNQDPGIRRPASRRALPAWRTRACGCARSGRGHLDRRTHPASRPSRACRRTLLDRSGSRARGRRPRRCDCSRSCRGRTGHRGSRAVSGSARAWQPHLPRRRRRDRGAMGRVERLAVGGIASAPFGVVRLARGVAGGCCAISGVPRHPEPRPRERGPRHRAAGWWPIGSRPTRGSHPNTHSIRSGALPRTEAA